MRKNTYISPQTIIIQVSELCDGNNINIGVQKSINNDFDFAKRHQAIDEEYDGGDGTSTNLWEDE